MSHVTTNIIRLEQNIGPNSVISPILQLRQTIYHSKELDELSRMKPKLRSGLEYKPSYGFKKVKKEKGGVSSF